MPDTQSVKVPARANAVVVRARDHTWVALAGGAGEQARELAGAEETSFAVPARGTYDVTTDGTLVSVTTTTVEPPDAGDEQEAAMLRLSSDATDRHVVDGVGEITADGAAFCTLTVEKLDPAGKPLRGRRDTDEVFLRTTGGALQDEGGGRIRSLRLRGGRATFRLISEPVPRLVTVEALGHPPLVPAELRIEFI